MKSIIWIMFTVLLCLLCHEAVGFMNFGSTEWDDLEMKAKLLVTRRPWKFGEIIQTEIVETYPRIRACPENFCDPCPVFKVLAAIPTGTSYDVIKTLYPSTSAEYQDLLVDPLRSRLCNDNQTVNSRCSFFDEFVLQVGGTKPLKIISILEPGYDDIYLRLRFANTDDDETDTETSKSNEEGVAESEDEDMGPFFVYVGTAMALVILLICLCGGIFFYKRKVQAQDSNDDIVPARNLGVRRNWARAVDGARRQQENMADFRITNRPYPTNDRDAVNSFLRNGRSATDTQQRQNVVESVC